MHSPLALTMMHIMAEGFEKREERKFGVTGCVNHKPVKKEKRHNPRKGKKR